MSYWTHIHGTIVVSPMGRTQAEKRYILDTVLDHLPRVSGSEEDMDVYVIQKNGYNSSSSCDEFMENTNNLIDNHYNTKSYNGWLNTQTQYILVVDGDLRDTKFEETYKNFQNWICRLAKRIKVLKIQVMIKDDYFKNCKKECKKEFITNDDYYYNMFVRPTYNNNDDEEENWCEYLMWNSPRNDKGDFLIGKPSVKDRIKKEYEHIY